MRADTLLRRYLEQRREMGETELVLEELTVEELRRLLSEPEEATEPAIEMARGSAARSGPDDASSPADWRAVLRAAEEPPPARATQTPVSAAPTKVPIAAPVGLVVGTAETELFVGPVGEAGSIDDLARMVSACQRCDLYRTATHPVPGEGSPRARLMCIGEAPGAQEDATGRPFVGQAGQLLTKILAAINLSRDEVFIANVLKHRPPGNRNPRPDEVTACMPYLVRQIELLRPVVIVAFGTFAAQSLLETKLAIGKLRGAVHRYRGIPVIVTYHPAALLRNPAWKRPTWEDVQLARRILDHAAA